MNPARESDPGEVWVAGSNLAAGYVGGQAPEKFCDNPHASLPGMEFLENGIYLLDEENSICMFIIRTFNNEILNYLKQKIYKLSVLLQSSAAFIVLETLGS